MQGLTEKRMAHSLGVARLMYRLARERGYDESFAKQCWLVGYLHDIGYEFSARNVEHAFVGGELLSESDYRFASEVSMHGATNVEHRSIVLDLLNEADLRVDSNGDEVHVEHRLDDIAFRYGKESNEYRNARQLAKEVGLL